MYLREPSEFFGSSVLPRIRRRGCFAAALVAFAAAALAIVVPAFLSQRTQVLQGLDLSARSIGHGVRMAIVAGDASAARDVLDAVAGHAGIAEVAVRSADGRALAVWEAQGAPSQPGGFIAWVLAEETVSSPVAGTGDHVELLGDGQAMSLVLLGQAAALLVGLLAGLAGALYLPRRTPCPAPPAGEGNAVGRDAGGLMRELQAWGADLMRENRQLAYQAAHDGLTGLPNRAAFGDRLDRALAEATRSGGRLPVLVADCDSFKAINDVRGHAVGDAVLADVATRLRTAVAGSGWAARLGGDEFAVVLAPGTAAADAARLADTLMSTRFTSAVAGCGEPVVASVSVGVAWFPDDAADAHGLLHCADQAMYRAKRARRAADPAQLAPGFGRPRSAQTV